MSRRVFTRGRDAGRGTRRRLVAIGRRGGVDRRDASVVPRRAEDIRGEEGVVDARGDPLRAPRELSDAEVWTEEPKLAEYVAGGRVNVSLRDGVR